MVSRFLGYSGGHLQAQDVPMSPARYCEKLLLDRGAAFSKLAPYASPV